MHPHQDAEEVELVDRAGTRCQRTSLQHQLHGVPLDVLQVFEQACRYVKGVVPCRSDPCSAFVVKEPCFGDEDSILISVDQVVSLRSLHAGDLAGHRDEVAGASFEEELPNPVADLRSGHLLADIETKRGGIGEIPNQRW
ncbi:MAG TPA: hypothetical protein VF787_19815 [Thermoanaerobaculia bacterium]